MISKTKTFSNSKALIINLFGKRYIKDTQQNRQGKNSTHFSCSDATCLFGFGFTIDYYLRKFVIARRKPVYNRSNIRWTCSCVSI